MPPVFICGPQVTMVEWSEDGQHLAILRHVSNLSASQITDLVMGQAGDKMPDEPETQLLAWGPVSHKTVTLMKFPSSQGEVNAVYWINGSSSLVVEGHFRDSNDAAMRQTITIVSTGGQTLTLPPFDPEKSQTIQPSPSKPIVAILEKSVPRPVPPGAVVVPENPDPATLRFFGTDGALSQPIRLPSADCRLTWADDGLPYVVSIEVQPGTKKRTRTWYLIDRQGQKAVLTNEPIRAGMPNSGGNREELVVQELSEKIAGSKLGIYAPTLVISPQGAQNTEFAIVTTDGKEGELSPKVTGVSYKYQGSLVVREIVKVPLEAYARARAAAIKAKLISQAKQVALGMLMYCNDWDDNFVGNTGDWKNQILPYLKDASIMDGFNYTFGGGNSLKIPEPATTQLGFIEGPGGRAVAFADGHVRWIPNP